MALESFEHLFAAGAAGGEVTPAAVQQHTTYVSELAAAIKVILQHTNAVYTIMIHV
jgi:hypothetical protein